VAHQLLSAASSRLGGERSAGPVSSPTRRYDSPLSAVARSSAIQLALRWRAVGTCFSQQAIEQKRSFIRPALHDATEQRYAVDPSGINLRHVAHTMLDIPTIVHERARRRDLPKAAQR
jgi:hypothetical protein